MTYNWTITNLYTVDLGSEPGYVVNALYVVEGSDGTYSATCQGSQQFVVNPDKPDYTPYADLTNDLVVSWIQADLGVDGVNNIYANIDGQIQSIINPPVSPMNTPLPWAAPVTE